MSEQQDVAIGDTFERVGDGGAEWVGDDRGPWESTAEPSPKWWRLKSGDLTRYAHTSDLIGRSWRRVRAL